MDLSYLPNQDTKEDDEIFDDSLYSFKELYQSVIKEFDKKVRRELHSLGNVHNFMGGD